jgi:hypothetical protein
MTTPRSGFDIGRVIVPIVSAVFGVGAAFATISVLQDDTREIRNEHRAHRTSDGHAEVVRRVSLLEQRIGAVESMRDDIKDLRRDVAATRRAVDAICAASPQCRGSGSER